jgi:hypothetical protein
LVGDYTNPILKPWAAEVVKKYGEISLAGVTFPRSERHSLSQVASGLRKKIEQLEEHIKTLRATGRFT